MFFASVALESFFFFNGGVIVWGIFGLILHDELVGRNIVFLTMKIHPFICIINTSSENTALDDGSTSFSLASCTGWTGY